MERTIFNAAQREVLDVMSCMKTDEDLRDLKSVLLNFLNEKMQNELERLWNEGAIDEAKLEGWRTAHFRTPYRQ